MPDLTENNAFPDIVQPTIYTHVRRCPNCNAEIRLNTILYTNHRPRPIEMQCRRCNARISLTIHDQDGNPICQQLRAPTIEEAVQRKQEEEEAHYEQLRMQEEAQDIARAEAEAEAQADMEAEAEAEAREEAEQAERQAQEDFERGFNEGEP